MATYKPIQSVTLTNSTNTSVTFSGIDQSYTDLYIVMNIKEGSTSTTGNIDVFMQINGDTATNYSMSQLYSTGSTPTANRSSSATYIYAASMPPNLNEFSNTRIDINGYSNATTWKTCLVKTGLASSLVAFRASQWRSTNAITSLKLYPESTYTFAAGSTFSLYGIKSGAPQALGGDIVATDGTYWYHAFTTTGTFTPLKSLSVDYLVIAGGGAGGSDTTSLQGGGGGGAGGYLSSVGSSGGGASAGSVLSLTAQGYAVTVGAGGGYRASGSNSTFSSITATGGGAGAYGATMNGLTGGSGGGGSSSSSPGSGGSATASPVQGYAGGAGQGTNNYRTGAGGGAGAVGGNGSGANGATAESVGGAGKNTLSAWASATNTGVSGYFAGGGGGGAGQFANPSNVTSDSSTSNGGAGGGGRGAFAGGSNVVATSGVANTGSGGGGSKESGTFTNSGTGGNGGSGIVIVRYAV